MFKKYKMWYRYSPKRDDSDLDYGAGRARKARRRQARPSWAPSWLPSMAASAAPSRLPSPAAAKPAPEMVAAAAMERQRVDEMKASNDSPHFHIHLYAVPAMPPRRRSAAGLFHFTAEMEMSQYQPIGGGEFPPALQYEFCLLDGDRPRYDAPFVPWGQYCVFISAGLIAVTLATILMTLYVATVLDHSLRRGGETYTATSDEDVSFGTVYPLYREKSTPRSTARLPDSLRKARANPLENASVLSYLAFVKSEGIWHFSKGRGIESRPWRLH
ncbi:hypothetical protein HPB51_012645 [Rhipicephalus microplus]|uniref:Uncharacterized protein n=1 Tax=Rhipicephalus microplus TaxID=6941 RepID=A0A9J6E0P5_RHIMP|nr:hypothetical protein HPB51_012645 [Rhipicephalus microplus]